MNVFERDAELLEKKASGIIGVWTCFKAAVKELLDSYNRHPRGQSCPAQILQDTDASIVIECHLGPAPKEDFSRLMLTITAGLKPETFGIESSVERWLMRLPGAPRKRDSIRRIMFSLEVLNNQLVLTYDGQSYSPNQAAEVLLETALLK